MKSSTGKLSDMERMKRELNAALPLPPPNGKHQPQNAVAAPAPLTPATDLNQVDDHAPSRSYSLYISDHDRLDAIRDRLKPYGIRKLNDSLALRLCVRFASESEDATKRLVELYELLKAQDGRRKRRQEDIPARAR